ncbi:hypothetical protein RDWZM_009821 [Blomia tropicalis]|uniref:Uncharacterized protein n=1 Tax=Blomia tropicalis TaxID=40697 RepID=A0A9Q0RLD8_BLOTA|nr:hypothetical protein RDWZM_009821 [Blomia tropicalis]
MSSIVLQNETITNYQSMEMKRRDRRFLGFDQPIIDSNPLPMLYIGEVDLSEFDECEYRLEPYRTRCQREYETYLRTVIARRHEKYILAQQQRIRSYGDGVGDGERSIETKKSRLIKPFVYSKNDEYIKQASCCGIWRARHCIIDSIEHNHNYFLKSGVCPNDLIRRFISLPNEPTTRVDVLDYCSEYSDASLICSGSSKTVAANKCQISDTKAFYMENMNDVETNSNVPPESTSDPKSTQLDLKKYKLKLLMYKKRYGNDFDPVKLPKYLHSFENYMLGKKEIYHQKNHQMKRPYQEDYPSTSRRKRTKKRGKRRSTLYEELKHFNMDYDYDEDDSKSNLSPKTSSSDSCTGLNINFDHNEINPIQNTCYSRYLPITQKPNSPRPMSVFSPSQDDYLTFNNYFPNLIKSSNEEICFDWQSPAVFGKIGRNIFFTPCFDTLLCNIRKAWNAINTEKDNILEERCVEICAFLECGQNLIRSHKNYMNNINCFNEKLTNNFIPHITSISMILAQYGCIQDNMTNEKLESFHLVADVRALVRIAKHIMPNECINQVFANYSKLDFPSSEDVTHVIERSWLPTLKNDGRFYWIIANRITCLLKDKLDLIISPEHLIADFEGKQRPKWWNIFTENCLSSDISEQLDFLFTDWKMIDVCLNLGTSAGRQILSLLNLRWHNPHISHLDFDLDIDTTIDRLLQMVVHSSSALKNSGWQLDSNNTLCLNQKHQGSWMQLSQITTFQGIKCLRSYRLDISYSDALIALFFPPTIIFHNERGFNSIISSLNIQ